MIRNARGISLSNFLSHPVFELAYTDSELVHSYMRLDLPVPAASTSAHAQPAAETAVVSRPVLSLYLPPVPASHSDVHSKRQNHLWGLLLS